MHTISDITSLRSLLQATRQAGNSVGLVPTMGNLHDGHLELVKTARANADFVVCSIFVNPLQFGPNEDLEAYPRTLGEDIAKLAAIGCDCLFMPTVAEIYGDSLQAQTIVTVPELSENYCGKSRPGHFAGVATVVSKLFNIVQPNSAVFGLKDYQQYLIIQKMVTDLKFDIQLIGVEIQREANGLALSSRNRYLNEEQQQKAALIYQCLLDIKKRILKGDDNFANLEAMAIERLTDTGFAVDYFAICNSANLQRASKQDRDFVILTAAQVGPSRLLDNVRFSLDS